MLYYFCVLLQYYKTVHCGMNEGLYYVKFIHILYRKEGIAVGIVWICKMCLSSRKHNTLCISAVKMNNIEYCLTSYSTECLLNCHVPLFCFLLIRRKSQKDKGRPHYHE